MKDLKPLIEQFLRLSGQPESAADIERGLAESVDLKEYVDPRASATATIQNVLEQLPTEGHVVKLVRPGGGSKFQWIFRSDQPAMQSVPK